MTDTRTNPLRRRSHQARRGGRAGRRCSFPWADRGVRARRGSRCCSSRPMARSSASRSTTAASSRSPATARASSPAATTARWSRPTRRAKARRSRRTPSTAGSTASRSGRTASSRWSAGKQAFVRTAKGEIKSLDLPVERRRACLRAERPAARGRALRRRVAVVSQRAGRARDARLERLAPRRAVQPGRQVPRHRHAGGDAARLAPDGRQGHAHVRLFGEGALDGVHAGRQVARDVGLRATHPLAVRQQGRPDGQAAAHGRCRYDKRAVAVACHPKLEIVAVGFEDGLVMLCRIDDGRRFWRRGRARAPSRRSPGARMARSSRSGPRTARPGSWIWREARHRNALKAVRRWLHD